MGSKADEFFGVIEQVFGGEAQQYQNNSNQVGKTIDMMATTKSLNDATAIGESLLANHNYLQEGTEGLKSFQDDMLLHSGNDKNFTAAQQLQRNALFQQVATKMYTQHMAAYNANKLGFATRGLDTSVTTLKKIMTQQNWSLHDGMQYFDKFLKPSFIDAAGEADKGTTDALLKKYREDVISSGIDALPPEQRAGAIKKFGDSLDNITKASLSTKAMQDTGVDTATQSNFFKKLIDGSFSSSAQASAYVHRLGLPDNLSNAYDTFTKIKALSIPELDEAVKDSPRLKAMAQIWKHQIALHIHTDPINWAAKTGAVAITPFDFSAPNIQAQSARREAEIKLFERKYNVTVNTALTDSELQHIHSLSKTMPPSDFSNMLQALPVQTTDSNALDKSVFEGASWLVAHARNGSPNYGAEFAKQLTLRNESVKSAELRKELRTVVISPKIEDKINNAFAENPDIATSAIAALKADAVLNHRSEVETHFFKADDDKHIITGSFLKNKNNYNPNNNLVYSSNPLTSHIINRGIEDFLDKKKTYYSAQERHPISFNDAVSTGHFVNLGINKIGIRIQTPDGASTILSNDNGEPILLEDQ